MGECINGYSHSCIYWYRRSESVSYTHLDVYKRQGFGSTGFYVCSLLLIILIIGIYVAYTGLIKMCIRDRPYADEVHEHTSVYQLNELDFMYRQLSADMQEEYV